MRVVLDGNVFVSAILSPKGTTGTVLRAWRDGRFLLVISPAILNEIGRVLAYPKIKKRHGWDSSMIQHFLDHVEAVGILTFPDVTLTVIQQDLSDNRYLECAVEGEANVIVSGDHHLLGLGMYDGIPIITVNTFVKMLSQRDVIKG